MNYIDFINFGIALIGAVLGVLATWHQWSQSQVKLRVVPKRSYSLGGTNIISGTAVNSDIQRLEQRCLAWWSIEVVNLSVFPLTISEVGFGSRKGDRHVVTNPMITNDQSLPFRLEPRAAVLVHSRSDAKFDLKLLKNESAFAVTDCGSVQYGSSPIFCQFVRALKADSDGGSHEK